MTKIYTVSVEELDGKSLVRFSNDMIEDIGWTTGDTAQIELQRLPADEQPSYVHIEAEEPDGSTVSEYWEDHKAYTLEITSTEQQMKKKKIFDRSRHHREIANDDFRDQLEDAWHLIKKKKELGNDYLFKTTKDLEHEEQNES